MVSYGSLATFSLVLVVSSLSQKLLWWTWWSATQILLQGWRCGPSCWLQNPSQLQRVPKLKVMFFPRQPTSSDQGGCVDCCFGPTQNYVTRYFGSWVPCRAGQDCHQRLLGSSIPPSAQSCFLLHYGPHRHSPINWDCYHGPRALGEEYHLHSVAWIKGKAKAKGNIDDEF